MAHELEFVNGKASMFYAADRGTPWHEEGTPLETAAGYEEALAAAGIDWEVELRKVRVVDGSVIPQYKAVVRKTDNKAVGVVGNDYKPIQNRQVFDFMESLFQDGQLLYESGGSLMGGSTVWMLARMTRDMRIGDDVFAQYMLATTNHNGTMSTRFDATDVRVVCANTLSRATGRKALELIRHTGDVIDKLEKARRILAITNETHRRMEQWLNEAQAVTVDEPAYTKVQTEIFGVLDDATPTQRRNAIDAFREIYEAEVERNGATAYSLINTITGYGDHKIRVTANGSRMASMLGGRSASFKSTGLGIMQKLVASA